MKAGWSLAPIGDVCDVVNGGTPKTGVPDYWGGQHQWITPAEMGKRSTPYVSHTERTITDQGLQNSSARPLPPMSIILSSRAPIGHLVINTEPMATNQGCKGLVPRKQIDHKFLYYYLGSIVDLLNDLGTGATFKELSGGKLKEVPVPLPPLPEQQRIAALLDEAFDGIATAKANAEKNLMYAGALFQSFSQNVFGSVNPDWEQETMLEVCSVLTCGVASTPTYVDESVGVPFLSAQNVKDGEVVLHKYRFISKEFHDKLTKKNKPKRGDILYSRVGAKYGEAAVVEHDFEFSVYVSLTLIRARPEKLNSHFLMFYLNSPLGKAFAKKSISSSGVPNLNVNDVRKFPVRYPSLKEQQQIVERLNALAVETQRLEGLYERKLNELDELKKVLLHQAFTGQV